MGSSFDSESFNSSRIINYEYNVEDLNNELTDIVITISNLVPTNGNFGHFRKTAKTFSNTSTYSLMLV